MFIRTDKITGHTVIDLDDTETCEVDIALQVYSYLHNFSFGQIILMDAFDHVGFQWDEYASEVVSEFVKELSIHISAVLDYREV